MTTPHNVHYDYSTLRANVPFIHTRPHYNASLNMSKDSANHSFRPTLEIRTTPHRWTKILFHKKSFHVRQAERIYM